MDEKEVTNAKKYDPNTMSAGYAHVPIGQKVEPVKNFNENHDEQGRFAEGDGTGGNSERAPSHGDIVEGDGGKMGVKGVTYKYEKINEGVGELHPLVSKSGLTTMRDDFQKNGVDHPFAKAGDSDINEMVGQMNNEWAPSNRESTVTGLSKFYLTKTGDTNPVANAESQLNKWGLSGETRIWHK